MGRFDISDHPDIAWIERTGYPSWMQETEVLNDEDDEEFYDDDDDQDDYDSYLDYIFEESRERELFGD